MTRVDEAIGHLVEAQNALQHAKQGNRVMDGVRHVQVERRYDEANIAIDTALRVLQQAARLHDEAVKEGKVYP